MRQWNKYVIPCVFNLSFLTMHCSLGSSNFRGGTKSYGIHIEASQLGTNLRYDLPAARVKASPSKDWRVTNNDAFMTSFLTPFFMTLTEIHPKFEMGGSWPEYKMRLKILDGKTRKKGMNTKSDFEGRRHIKSKDIFRIRRRYSPIRFQNRQWKTLEIGQTRPEARVPDGLTDKKA